MLIELQTCVGVDGYLECTAFAGGVVWRCSLGPDELAWRARLARDILDARDDFDRVSFWHSGQPQFDRRLEALDAAHRDLHLWDLCRIVHPLFAALQRRFPGEPWLVVGEGRPGLPLFDVRGALRVGVLRGLVPPEALTDTCTLHAWAGSGCAALRDLAVPDDLPSFCGPALRLLLAPPPAELDDYFLTLARATRHRVDADVLIHDSLDTDELQLAAMVIRDGWQAHLQDAVCQAAGALGADVRVPATRRDLADALAADDPQTLLVLVAHQDRHGVHLADGPVGIPALADHLLDLRTRGARPCGSVDLGVCHAANEGNLADCLQAFGVPVVHTHGHYAHYARVLATWLWALRILSDGRRRSLPGLLDGGWLRWRAVQSA